jgi:hypothetical protein
MSIGQDAGCIRSELRIMLRLYVDTSQRSLMRKGGSIEIYAVGCGMKWAELLAVGQGLSSKLRSWRGPEFV